MKTSIVLFDGDCNTCTSLMQFVLKRSNTIKGYSLQSDTARKILHNDYSNVISLDTLVMIDDNRLYLKSDAVLHILRKMKGFWPALFVFMFVPRALRDAIYQKIARNRKRWFGKNNSCSVETKA